MELFWLPRFGHKARGWCQILCMQGLAWEARSRSTAAVVYALSSVALACALYYVPYEDRHPVALLVLFSPLVFLVPYVRFLLKSATTKQKVAAAVLNAICGAVVATYVGTRPSWPPPPELPFEIGVALLVIVSAVFVLAAIALFSRYRAAYIAATTATLLMWPCLLLDSLAGRNLGLYGLASLACVPALLGFTIAADTVFLRPIFGYRAGLAAAIFAWPYSVLREMSYPYGGNSWTMFNLPGDPHGAPELIYAKISIFLGVFVIVSTITSLLRLCPASWTLKGVPIRSRTWLAFTLSFVVVVAWFAHSVTPYRVPTETGGLSPEIRVVHLVKKGLHLSETRISVMRDGRFYISCDIREPMQYQSDGELFRGFVPRERSQQILDFVRVPEFKVSGSSLRDLPRRWNSDAWYVDGERVPFVVFSAATNTAPPKELVDWFNEMKGLPKEKDGNFTTRDVCLGFCYEPRL